MTTNGESKFSRLLIGLGLGAMVGLMAAILARKETLDGLRERSWKSLGYLNQLAGDRRCDRATRKEVPRLQGRQFGRTLDDGGKAGLSGRQAGKPGGLRI